MHPYRSFITGVLVAAPLLIPYAQAQQGTDEQWEVTMTMEMAGMPSMPAMTMKVCKPKDKSEEDLIPKEKDCKVLEQKRSGSKFSFKIQCDRKGETMIGTGETEYLSKDAYRGTLRMTGTADGQKMDMKQSYTGKRAGTCSAEAQKKELDTKIAAIQAQGNEAIAKVCNDGMGSMQPLLFIGDGAICKDRKNELCSAATKASQDLRDPAVWPRYEKKSWRDAVKACGGDDVAVVRDACKNAGGKREHLMFIAGNCKDEAAVLRKANCDGRTYTSVDVAYRDFCGATGGLSDTAVAPDAKAAQPAATQPAATQPATTQPAAAPPADNKPKSTTDKLKEGADKLKKFLKF